MPPDETTSLRATLEEIAGLLNKGQSANDAFYHLGQTDFWRFLQTYAERLADSVFQKIGTAKVLVDAFFMHRGDTGRTSLDKILEKSTTEERLYSNSVTQLWANRKRLLGPTLTLEGHGNFNPQDNQESPAPDTTLGARAAAPPENLQYKIQLEAERLAPQLTESLDRTLRTVAENCPLTPAEVMALWAQAWEYGCKRQRKPTAPIPWVTHFIDLLGDRNVTCSRSAALDIGRSIMIGLSACWEPIASDLAIASDWSAELFAHFYTHLCLAVACLDLTCGGESL